MLAGQARSLPSLDEGRATRGECQDVASMRREKIRQAKAQQDLSLAAIVRDDENNVFTNILVARGGPRRISLLYSTRWGTSPPRRRKRLKFSTPSSLPSLAVRPAILRVLSPLSWKTGPGSRINAPQFPVPSLLLSVLTVAPVLDVPLL